MPAQSRGHGRLGFSLSGQTLIVRRSLFKNRKAHESAGPGGLSHGTCYIFLNFFQIPTIFVRNTFRIGTAWLGGAITTFIYGRTRHD
jgi:hypothetical protein